MERIMNDKYRVLVIEDDQAIANLILTNLSRAGLSAHHASDGIQGLIEFKEFDPHIVLTDLKLPNMSGRELCAEIRKISLIPIVLMTSADTSEAEAEAFEAGADDYIAKPFDPRVLVLRIGAHLRRVYDYDLQAARSAQQSAAPVSEENQTGRPQPGWANCGACRYLGPATAFRQKNSYGQRYVICPHCRSVDDIIFG
jgi:DNA-binding response OmpR family regulator